MKIITTEDLYNLLENIKTRPEIYIGTKSLMSLRYFLDGALHFLSLDEESNCADFLRGFQEWIEIRYDVSSDHHWSSIIMFYSSNEADAFDTFFIHLRQFLSLDTNKRDYTNIIKKKEEWLKERFSHSQKYRSILESVWDGSFYE